MVTSTSRAEAGPQPPRKKLRRPKHKPSGKDSLHLRRAYRENDLGSIRLRHKHRSTTCHCSTGAKTGTSPCCGSLDITTYREGGAIELSFIPPYIFFEGSGRKAREMERMNMGLVWAWLGKGYSDGYSLGLAFDTTARFSGFPFPFSPLGSLGVTGWLFIIHGIIHGNHDISEPGASRTSGSTFLSFFSLLFLWVWR
jgi:hypothetical protein